MSRPPHSPWFNHPNNIRWRIQTVKFIIMLVNFIYLLIYLRNMFKKYKQITTTMKGFPTVSVRGFQISTNLSFA
jgi:hypothetical protein